MKRMKLLFTLAIPVLLCQSALAQNSSRLAAQAHWSHDGVMFKPWDSTSYFYASDLRGGDLTHTMKYDHFNTWRYNADSARFYDTVYYTQEFDVNNNVSMTTIQTWSWITATWAPTNRTLYTYTNSNMVATKIWQSWGGTAWLPVSKNVYTYNAANSVILDQYQKWNGLTNSFDPYSQKTYSYDPLTHMLINETDQDLFSGTPVYTSQYVYTYTSKNQMLTTTYSTWSSGWVNNKLTTNAYDSSGNRITQLVQNFDGSAMAWVNAWYMIYSNFTPSHLAQTEIDQVWSTAGSGMWLNTMKYTYTYNSYDQMTSSTGQSWNVVGIFEFATGDQKANYYYATYHISAVNNVSSVNGAANIFPVPAQGLLHVDLKWNEAQAATIAIYDMTGRIVTPVINVPSAVEYHTSLSVNHLSAGNYIIKINGA